MDTDVSKFTGKVFLLKQQGDASEGATGNPDPFAGKYGANIVEPPYNPDDLLSFVDVSNILPQCLDAMKDNVAGFGWDLRCLVPEGEEKKNLAREIEAERDRVDLFLTYSSYEVSLTDLLKEIQWDKDAIGNSWLEIVPNNKGDIDGFSYLNGASMRITKLSKAIEIEEKRLRPDAWEYETVKRWKRFRMYVQLVGSKKTWFKELGDPRDIDRNTGEEITEEMVARAERAGKEVKKANAAVHFRHVHRKYSYGVPQWLGVVPEIAGIRAAAELNWYTFNNGGVGQFMIFLSGGHWGTEQIKRIQEFVDQKAAKGIGINQALVLEAVGQQVSPSASTTTPCRIEVKEIGITKEGVFLEYDDKGREKVRSTFRLPPIYVGLAEDYTRATAAESKKVAEEQVFKPARVTPEFFINRKIFPLLDVRYHAFVLLSAKIDNAQDRVEMISTAVKAGLPLRHAIQMLADAFGITVDMGEVEGKWLDLPLPVLLDAMRAGMIDIGTGTAAEGDEEGGDDDDAEKRGAATVAQFIRSVETLNGALRKEKLSA